MPAGETVAWGEGPKVWGSGCGPHSFPNPLPLTEVLYLWEKVTSKVWDGGLLPPPPLGLGAEAGNAPPPHDGLGA